jgi:RHS repeat-associated protein
MPNSRASCNNDRLASDAYDNNGNTTSSSGNGYLYDFENRLLKLNAGTAGEVSFVYDGDGNRVSKTVGGVTTKYLVDTNNPTGYAQVVEEIVSGNVQRVYVYGHTRISQQQLIGGNWLASFYGYDGHGSVRLLTNATGTVTDTYTYDAFGVLINRTGTTPNDYLYAGEQFDAQLGLYYNRARYLNAATGRFFSMDSFEGRIRDPQSLHKYLYANANPINQLDPSGHISIPSLVAGIVVLAILAAGSLYYVSESRRLRNLIINVNVEWTTDFRLDITKPSLSSDEIDIVKDRAMDTMRNAYKGFNVRFNEGGPGSRTIKIVNQYNSSLGQTVNISRESYVYMQDHKLNLDSIIKTRNMTISRTEYLEAFGRGVGATAAHELGHQANFGWTLDRTAEPATYDYDSGGYEHFFTEKYWSQFALNQKT